MYSGRSPYNPGIPSVTPSATEVAAWLEPKEPSEPQEPISQRVADYLAAIPVEQGAINFGRCAAPLVTKPLLKVPSISYGNTFKIPRA